MNRQRLDNRFSGEFSQQIALGQEPVRQAIEPQQAVSAVAKQPRCLSCGSWAVYPVGLLYASSTETRAAMSPQGVPSARLASWLAELHPPEKMTTWTGFRLALLLWPPCIFLLAQMLYTQTTTGSMEDKPSHYLIGLGVGVIAWAGPALGRRRKARYYNSGSWEEEMREWHAARVCLNCGIRSNRLDRLLSNTVKEGLL